MSIFIQENYDLRVSVKPENQKAPSSVIIPIVALELFFSEVPFAFINLEKGYRFLWSNYQFSKYSIIL